MGNGDVSILYLRNMNPRLIDGDLRTNSLNFSTNNRGRRAVVSLTITTQLPLGKSHDW